MAALAVAALRDLSRLGAAAPWRTMDDFPDFYCAGWALDRRANPYTYEPLHACERRVNIGDTFRGHLFARNPRVAFPAPLPAYDFFPFMALARLPLADARAIDAAAIVASIALTALTLAGLGVPLDLSVAALLLSTGFVELNTGQVVPFALLALVLCGLAVARGNDRLAGILAVVTSIEPIVGVPVIAATLCFLPRARWSVVLTGGIFALLALRAVGAPVLLEYALRVVPAQAASEIHFPFQYSLTYALAYFGSFAGAGSARGRLLLSRASRNRLVAGATSDVGRGQTRTARLSSCILLCYRRRISPSGRAMLRAAGASRVGDPPTGACKNRFRGRFVRPVRPVDPRLGHETTLRGLDLRLQLHSSALARSTMACALRALRDRTSDLRLRTTSAASSGAGGKLAGICGGRPRPERVARLCAGTQHRRRALVRDQIPDVGCAVCRARNGSSLQLSTSARICIQPRKFA